MQVQVLQFEGGYCSPESAQIGSVDPVIVLVSLGENEVKIPRDRPRSIAGVADGFQFLQEENLVPILWRAID